MELAEISVQWQAFVLKVNVKLYLCSTMHHTMKTYGGLEAQLHALLIPELHGRE
jgi:hypothetical protein